MRNSAENETFLFIVDDHGRNHAPPALDGWRAMEVIRDRSVDLAALCGGACPREVSVMSEKDRDRQKRTMSKRVHFRAHSDQKVPAAGMPRNAA
jgi:hypothetical protein